MSDPAGGTSCELLEEEKQLQLALDLQLAHEIQQQEQQGLEYYNQNTIIIREQEQEEEDNEVDVVVGPNNNNTTTSTNGSGSRDDETPPFGKLWLFLLSGGALIIVLAIAILVWQTTLPPEEDDEPFIPDDQQTLPPTPTKPPIFNDYYVGESFPGTMVLKSDQYLVRGDNMVSSPSGKYRVGMTKEEGDLVLLEVTKEAADEATAAKTANDTTTSGASSKKITTKTIWNAGVVGGIKVYMQDDGNLVIRGVNGESLWSSGTYEHYNSALIVDDGGRIGVRWREKTLVWMEGIPQGIYQGPSSADLTFPVRGAFYYSWYPRTWAVSNGDLARFEPDLGYYLSGDPEVVDSHIDQLQYARIDVGIISWWGPDTNMDIARITQLMDRTLELNATIKWTIYYEDEWKLDPSVAQLRVDLQYIKKWFAWHPAYAHVNGKPLIFIWNENDCEVVERWMEAAGDEWHVVPKLFGGFRDCPVQPHDGKGSWHQYGPASAYQEFVGYSVSISPGFWHAGEPTARLPRLSSKAWCGNVQRMVNSKEPWQLITTFNEAGEGTGIETSSRYWPSTSGYGYYLDCLHEITIPS